MDDHLILWPVLAQIALTLMMYIRLAVVKKAEIDAGNVDLKKTALDASAWPESVIKINNNLRNQFEVPILFYFLSYLLMSLHAAGNAAIILAAVFSISRFGHAFVHTTSNKVPLRLPLFLVGMASVMGMLGLAFHAVARL